MRVEFAVTLSSTGAINRFKEMTPATSGVIARFPLLFPIRNLCELRGLCRRSYFGPRTCNRISPNRQPATVGEEEQGGTGTTWRRTSSRATPKHRPPPTARNAQPPRTSTSHPPATRRSPPRTLSQTTHIDGNPHTVGDGHRPEDAHDGMPLCVGVPRATHADSRA